MHRIGRWLLRAGIGVLLAGSAVAQQEPEFALLFRGGTVVDGTLASPRPADVGIRGDVIAAIGDLSGRTAARVVDATGLVIAPGFVDVHTHADRAAARRGDARNFVAMGVTTIITGNCGGSVTDLATHLAEVEKHGIAVNYGSLIGHGTVREAVMGRANRAPTADELAKMRALVRREMAAGAFGLSTGLIYVPGTYAKTDELVALCEEVASFGGLYATHMRDEGDHVLESIDEAIEIGRRAGLPVHLSHLKASGKPNWGKSEQIVARLEAARADGLAVTGDQYAYTASSTTLLVLFPSAELAEGPKAFAARLRDDAAFHATMVEALYATMDTSGFGDLSFCQIASAPGSRDLQGLRIAEAAERRFGETDRHAQAETAIDLVIAAGARRVSMVYHKMAEPDVERLMALPYVGIASDSGIRMYDTAEKPHPRGAGNNPRVLGRYVRERKVLSLELAVHKMTELPATVFGIERRGVVREGAFADLCVFDPATVIDRATYAEPLAEPRGIAWVLVNGVPVVADGQRTDARPGRVLRHSKPKAAEER